MAFTRIASLVSDFIIQPWINNLPGRLWFAPDSAELKFLDYEREPLTSLVPLKHTIMFLLLVVLAYGLFVSWNSLQEEQEELGQLYKNCCTAGIYTKVTEFSTGTETCFNNIERKLKALQNRFTRAKTVIEKDTFCENFKLDLDETRGCWSSNISSFMLIDLKSDAETDGEWAQRMEFYDMEQEFDAAIADIEGVVDGMYSFI